MRGRFVDGSGLKADFAPRCRRSKPLMALQGGGFAGAVRAENGDDFALSDGRSTPCSASTLP
jgi:hypothetical protein